MRIGYFADGPWSHLALERLLDQGHDLKFIVPRYDTRDPVLKDWSEKLSIPFLIEKNVNDLEFINSLVIHEAELFISMSFNQILKSEIINIAPEKFINCHAGKLPFYRGRNPLNWALINGEEEIGVTTHYVDEGIDTGDIITQKTIRVTSQDTYSTLLDKVIKVCPMCLCEAVQAIESGKVRPIKQSEIHPIGTYFGMRRVGDEILDWSWSSERIFNFVRAITLPGPGARTYVNGSKEIAILKANLIESAPAYTSTEGEVVGQSDDGVVVKTGDTTILVSQILDIDEDQIKIPKLKIGTRLLSRRQ